MISTGVDFLFDLQPKPRLIPFRMSLCLFLSRLLDQKMVIRGHIANGLIWTLADASSGGFLP